MIRVYLVKRNNNNYLAKMISKSPCYKKKIRKMSVFTLKMLGFSIEQNIK